MTTQNVVIGPIYCLKCKTKTGNREAKRVRMKNGRGATEAICSVCGTKKYRIGGPAPTLQAPIPAEAYEEV